jgi:hypothetical protein
MRKIAITFAGALGLGLSGLAQAGGAWTARAGLDGGSYKFDDRYTDSGGLLGIGGAQYVRNDNDSTYGVLLGTTVGVGWFFGDFGTEVSKYAQGRDLDRNGTQDDVYRSDVLATFGAYVGNRWTVFAGYREAQLGTGLYSEKSGNTEKGPFLGGGVSFRPGSRVAIGGSLAYNFLNLSQQGSNVDNFSLNGLSAKVQASLLGTPHSVFLRWQHFHGTTTQASVYAYEYNEDYLNLGYQATFGFKTW